MLGILRSPSLSLVSGQWSSFPLNPILMPPTPVGCSMQYHRLFAEPDGSIFFAFWAINSSMSQLQFYQLMPGAPATMPMIVELF